MATTWLTGAVLKRFELWPLDRGLADEKLTADFWVMLILCNIRIRQVRKLTNSSHFGNSSALAPVLKPKSGFSSSLAPDLRLNEDSQMGLRLNDDSQSFCVSTSSFDDNNSMRKASDIVFLSRPTAFKARR